LQSKFDKAERQRKKLLAELADWTPEQLAFRPAAGGWSALEVVDHLVKMDRGIAGQFAAEPSQRKVLGKTKWRSRIVNTYLRFPTKFLVPESAGALHPSPQVPLGENAEKWQAARASIAQSLERMNSGDVDRTIMRHPRAGWYGAKETLQLLTAHTLHHRYQVSRIRKAMTSGSNAGRV
jgi:uncharacterized damage-inducible protein DinB